MSNIIQEFRSFPKKARRYILYHSIISPALIVSHMLPIYLLYMGYTILEIGALYTIVTFINIVGTYLVGKLLDKINANKALSLDVLFDGISSCILGFAKGIFLPFLVVISSTIQNLSSMFSPAYSVYEFESYPEEKREKIYVYHLVVPEITQLTAFPIFGIIWGILYPTPFAFRVGFLIFGIYFIFSSILPLKFLPPIKNEVKVEKKITLRILIPKELRIIMLIEVIILLAWGVIPQIVLINYVITKLKGTLFHMVIIEMIISIIIIFTGRLIKNVDKKHRFTLLIGGTIIMMIYVGLMNFAFSFPIVLLAYGIMAFGDTIWHPYHQSLLFHYIPAEKRGEFFGAFTSIKKIIGISLPLLAGLIAYKIHPLANYTISFVFFLIVILLYLYLKRRS